MKTKTYVHNLSRIAWAYVFLLIDFSMSVNDFSINVLPGWVGFLLIFLALPSVEEQEPSASLLRPLVILLGLWEVIRWVGTLVTGSVFDVPLLTLILSALSMYFHFQFLTNLSSIARTHGLLEDSETAASADRTDAVYRPRDNPLFSESSGTVPGSFPGSFPSRCHSMYILGNLDCLSLPECGKSAASCRRSIKTVQGRICGKSADAPLFPINLMTGYLFFHTLH